MIKRIILLLLVAITFNSCKKDLLTPSALKKQKDINIEFISYQSFLSSIDVDKIGVLKPVLLSAGSSGQNIKMGGNELNSPSFEIDSKAVKKLTVKGVTSYVISLKPRTPKAISFENITIQVGRDETTAFLTTYTPTKEWIKEWRQGIHSDSVFRGQMSGSRLNLKDLPQLNLKAGQQGNAKIMGINSATNNITLNGQPISLVSLSCQEYDVYETVTLPCKHGHLSRATCDYLLIHTDWEPENGDWPPIDVSVWVGTTLECSMSFTPDQVGGGGGGGSTTPNPPDGYNPCDCDPEPVSVSNAHNAGGLKLSVLPPANCCEDGELPQLPPVVNPFNENDPFILPVDWALPDPNQEWTDAEDELDNAYQFLVQDGAYPSSLIPEMYYINGIKVDMLNAPIKNGTTVLGFPRNNNYFWKQVVSQKPQMFSEANRIALAQNRSPIVDAQWIKYNPTHKNYMDETLIHHHDKQGRYAFAIPRKVHVKWSAILHTLRLSNKLPSVKIKGSALSTIFQIFTLLTDIKTGNPDAWINWFGSHDEVGVLYSMPSKNVYWEITKQTVTKNSSGTVVRAKVYYDIYADYIWDDDEKRYMGVIKLGSAMEDFSPVTKQTYDSQFFNN